MEGKGGYTRLPLRGKGHGSPFVQTMLYRTHREGKNALTESPLALSVRASSSPYIGDGDALYRSADTLSVCSSQGIRNTLGNGVYPAPR